MAAGYAFDEINNVLPEMAAAFTEDWILDSMTWPAISIEKLAVGSKVMKGGQLIDANTVIFVSEDIFQSSAVKKGNLITARGTELAVLEIDQDGDASRSLVCGPAQIDNFR